MVNQRRIPTRPGLGGTPVTAAAAGGDRDARERVYHSQHGFKKFSFPSHHSYSYASSLSSSSVYSSSGSSDSSSSSDQEIFQKNKKEIRKERNRLSAMESRLKKERLIQDLTLRAETLEIENQKLHLLLSQTLKLLNPSVTMTSTTIASSSSSPYSQEFFNNYSTKESAIVFH